MRRPQLHTPFYGWIVVASVFTAGAFAGGIGFWGLGVFVLPMEADLGWSRTTIFAALSIRALVGGVLSPLVGPWFDSRHGPRRMAVMGSLLLGLSLMGLKYVESVWQFYLLYGVLGSLASLTMGQNMAQVLVPKWFVRRRGRALGFATMGTPLSGLIFPIPLLALVVAIGWRDTWFVLGVVALVVLLPASFLIRTRPEDQGLLPDGDTEVRVQGSPGQRGHSVATERSYTRSEAMRSRSFWLILLAVGVVGMGVQGFQPSWQPYFVDIGFSATTGAQAIAIYGICAAAARLIWGTLAEHFPSRNLMVVQTTLTAMMIAYLLFVVDSPLTLFVYAALQGLTLGGQFILQPLMVANYFGREHLGAVRGIMRPFITLAAAAGPLFVAGLFDATGTYHVAFIAVLATWLIAALIYLLAVPAVGAQSTEQTQPASESPR
jgi:sugar phosphate permease